MELVGDPPGQRHGRAGGARADAEPSRAEPHELVGRRHARRGEDVERRRHCLRDPPDLIGLDEAGDEGAVGAGVDESAQAVDRGLEQLLALEAEPEDIGAGVDEELDPGVLGGGARGFDPGALLGEVDQRPLLARRGVLEVDPDRAGLDRRRDGLPHRGGGIAVAGLDVGADRHLDGGGDAGDGCHHLVPGKAAVGPARGEGDTRAGRPDRLEAPQLEEPGAAGVPGVREDQQADRPRAAGGTPLLLSCCDALATDQGR